MTCEVVVVVGVFCDRSLGAPLRSARMLIAMRVEWRDYYKGLLVHHPGCRWTSDLQAA